jgi:hypothetical protein
MKSFPYKNATNSYVSLENSKIPTYQSNGRYVQKVKFNYQWTAQSLGRQVAKSSSLPELLKIKYSVHLQIQLLGHN